MNQPRPTAYAPGDYVIHRLSGELGRVLERDGDGVAVLWETGRESFIAIKDVEPNDD